MQFAGSVEGLSKIVWNGNLSVKLARKHIGTLRAWYTEQKDKLLCYVDEKNPGYYNAEIAEMLAGIAEAVLSSRTTLRLTESLENPLYKSAFLC